jgi:two-component system phosphate regulon sensor histidine kinase PhoR
LINATACRLLGITVPAQIGAQIKGYLNNSELENWINDVLKSGDFPRDYINREILFDEEEGKIYSITLAPIRSNDENVSGLALVLMDVSDEKRLEKRKIEFQKLVSVVAHELKAPINAIQGYLELILNGYLDDDRNKEMTYLQRCYDKSDMLRNLVHDLLSLTSIDSGKMTKQMVPVNLRPVLIDVITFAENEAQKKNISVVRDIPEQLPLVIGDKNALSYLFTNLMSNAIKYNRENGTVTIKAVISSEDIVISFIDTGIGIEKKEIDKIFNEFYRSDNKAIQKVSGTGLGLAIAKRFAELHNGSIHVSSEIGIGSQFDIRIPILKMI